MDDEECLPENSNLTLYLQSLGYNDMELKKSSNSKTALLQPQKSKNLNVELIDEDVMQQIGILISTQMLFEEDVKNIENLLSNFKVKKHGMLKSMFQGTFAIIVIFLGLFLYWIIGSYIVFIGSSFYAYKAAEYLWKKDFSSRRLKKLTSILKSNYILLSRTVKFINENDKIVEWNRFNNNEALDELNTGYEFYNSFKLDFYLSLKEMINVLTHSTKKLISKIPLSLYLENPNCYICNNFNEQYEPENLFKLYQVYLLAQSEFLQRFILSLVPNFNISQSNNFQELNRILTESCVSLLKVKNNLNRKFKFIFLNGIYSSKSQSNLNSFVKPKVYTSKYEEELVSNIHDVSNTFQNLLIKSRILEESLKLNKMSPNMENDLISLQTELNICQRNISDGFILLKKVNGLKEKSEKVITEKKNAEEIVSENKKVLVGYTDLDPATKDEIFEAYFGECLSDNNYTKYEDWDFEELVKKRLQKEYSQNVLMELKTKLVEKAKDWEKREAKLLSQKNTCQITESPEEEIQTLKIKNQSSDFSLKEILESNNKNNQTKECNSKVMSEFENQSKLILDDEPAKRKLYKSFFEEMVVQDETISESSNNLNGEFHKNCLDLVNKNFLKDLNAARQKILQKNSAADEQLFCDSSSDNSEENIFQ